MARPIKIEELWKSYERAVVPKDAPPIQRSECRKAFWAGAAATFGGIVHMLDEGEDATDSDLSAMDDLHTQFEAFAKSQGE